MKYIKLFEDLRIYWRDDEKLNLANLIALFKIGYQQDDDLVFSKPSVMTDTDGSQKYYYPLFVNGEMATAEVKRTELDTYKDDYAFQEFLLQQNLIQHLDSLGGKDEIVWLPIIKQKYPAYFAAKRSGIV